MTRDYRLFRKRRMGAETVSFSGAVHPAVLAAVFLFFISGVAYLYAMNRGAVQGYETRTLEREISELKKENAKLKLSEAEVLSLSRIEESSRNREMVPVESIRTIENRGSIAILR